MARRGHPLASREQRQRRITFWLLLVVGAMFGGALLGKMSVGDRLRVVGSETRPFSSLSANPDAATPDRLVDMDCVGCPDSFGIGARLGRNRADDSYAYPYAPVTLGGEASAAPKEIANVEPVDDGYRYGGRFPDPAPDKPRPTSLRSAAAMGDGGFETRPLAEKSPGRSSIGPAGAAPTGASAPLGQSKGMRATTDQQAVAPDTPGLE